MIQSSLGFDHNTHCCINNQSPRIQKGGFLIPPAIPVCKWISETTLHWDFFSIFFPFHLDIADKVLYNVYVF